VNRPQRRWSEDGGGGVWFAVRNKLPTGGKGKGREGCAKNNPLLMTWLAGCSRADSLDEACACVLLAK
jgi:hypothetical protein